MQKSASSPAAAASSARRFWDLPPTDPNTQISRTGRYSRNTERALRKLSPLWA